MIPIISNGKLVDPDYPILEECKWCRRLPSISMWDDKTFYKGVNKSGFCEQCEIRVRVMRKESSLKEK